MKTKVTIIKDVENSQVKKEKLVILTDMQQI